MRSQAWFIYALGGGWGHLNRALALTQVAAEQRPVHVLVNSPYAGQIPASALSPNLFLHRLSAEASLSETRQAVHQHLARHLETTLIVDTFPRGLIGELADWLPQSQSCRVLIHRDLNPNYIAAKNILAFAQQHYDGILLPGEYDVPLAGLPQVKQTAPWLSRSASALATPAVHLANFRTQHAITRDRPLILVCAAGKPSELAFFGQLTMNLQAAFPQATVRCMAATCPPHCHPDYWFCHWPGIEAVSMATVVVGGGGYNLIHECKALNRPLISFAFARRYDRQAKRIKTYGQLATTRADAIAQVGNYLQQARYSNWHAPTTVTYENGTVAAAAAIAQFADKKYKSSRQ